jgi:NhaP-type Na+/H+ or K+/H+ antiporter
VGSWLALLKTRLNTRERLFCVLGFLPKSSVQAAIGALPLAAGLAGGEAILSVAVLAILVTAPLGALAIETLGPRWLEPSAVQPALDEV